MKKEINVYYHICLMNDGFVIAIEQLHLLASCGLMYNAKTVNIGIRYDSYNEENKNFLLKIINDYNIKNNINILYCSDNKIDNKQELSTSIYFKNYADSLSDTDSYILYFHTKGVSRYGTESELPMRYWRNLMEYFMILKWKDCYEVLDDGYESCGTSICNMDLMDRCNNIASKNNTNDNSNRYYYPGTFYWLNTSLIKRIPEKYFDIKNEYGVHSIESLPGIVEHKQFSFSDINLENINPYKIVINPMEYINY